MQRHCLALDLKDDPAVIAEYEAYHRAVWPEIIESITKHGFKKIIFVQKRTNSY